MIDIHCHILSGIDDGAKDIEDSLAMARLAVQEGIRTIIATPHHDIRFNNPKELILKKTEELNERLASENIPLKVLPGQELLINGDIIGDLAKGSILTLSQSQYLFIELPSGHVPRYTERLLYELQLKGITPIIVHPERNQEMIERPELLYQFVKNGALSQITAASVCGIFGKKIKVFSEQLIEASLTHFVASDAHNIHKRSFNMVKAYDQIESKYGIDLVYMFTENAELIVEGKNVFKEIPQRVKKKKFLGFF